MDGCHLVVAEASKEKPSLKRLYEGNQPVDFEDGSRKALPSLEGVRDLSFDQGRTGKSA